jgi:glycosyltransferase involved in cell wall biosynthesis
LSIRSQDYRPIELIVIDNQSTDGTLQIASLHADVAETFGPERSAQRNRGALISTGNYLLFIDSDMLLERQVVGDCVDAAQASGLPAVVIPETSVGEGFLARCRALERSCYVGDDQIEAARFFLRDTFKACGGFDERLTAFEDWDLSRRLGGGHSLPRTSSYVLHDEGTLRLAALLAKKKYYARSFALYLRKHGRSAVRQSNLILRPAILRNWRRLLRHPVLAAGILSLKTLEAAAAGWGLLEVWLGTASSAQSTRTRR